ncbi:MAG: hypothetical protein AABP62_24650 [Planctomycetota bacterium]
MDEEAAKGCMGCMSVVSLIATITMIVVGGNFRTEVTYVPPHVATTGSETPFEESLTAQHWLVGLVKGTQPDLKTVMAKYVRPGEEVTTLTITTRHSFLDNLISGITLFIYCPQTVTIKGAIAKTAKPGGE